MSFENYVSDNSEQEVLPKKEENQSGGLKRSLKKAVTLGALTAALTTGEGCAEKDEGGTSKEGARITENITESSEKISKSDLVSAEEIEATERAADKALMSYLEALSYNSVSGDRLGTNDGGDVFVELYGAIYELDKETLLKLRSTVLKSRLSPDVSVRMRQAAAQALKSKIDLEVSAYGKKIEDVLLLPTNMRERFSDLRGDSTKSKKANGGIRKSPDFDKGADF